MNNTPFFSVVMPVYNVEKYLDDAIKSVLRQTFGDFELILVDDGSTDASSAIARKYQVIDSRIRLVWQENAGLGAARNKGMEYAGGSYIYFMDSDDMIDMTTLQYVHELISRNNYPDVIAFNAMPFLDAAFGTGEGDAVLQENRRHYEQTYLIDKLYSGIELYRERTRKQNFLPSAWLFVIKAAFLKEINLKFVDGVIHEDEDFSRYLFVHANTVYFTNKKLYQYRIRKTSIMQAAVSKNRVFSLIIVAERIYALYEQYRNVPELKGDALWLYNFAVNIYEKYLPREKSIEERMAASSLFIHNLRQIRPAGREFEMFIPPFCLHQYVDDNYQPLTARIVSNYVLEDSTFIDIGAGFGYFSLLAATRSKAKKIISIETDPNAFEVLSKNVSLNQLQNIVLYTQGILTGERNQVEIDYINSMLLNDINLDLFFKISANGNETMILNKIKPIIKRLFPRVRMIVEYDPKMMKQAECEPGDLFDLLYSLDFDVLILDDILQVACRVDAGNTESYLDKLDGRVNLLCLPKHSPVSVLFFSHSSLLAGSERSLRTLISAFPKIGMIPTVVLPSDGPFKQYLEEMGAVTVVFPFGWWSDIKQVGFDEGQTRLANDFRAVQEGLVPLLSQINPNVILTNTSVIPWGSICAFLINKPHLWYVHELGLPEHGINYFYPREVIAEYITGGSNMVITNSSFTQKSFFGESDPMRAEIIHPVVGTNKKQPVNEESFFHQPDSFKLACLGGIVPGKGQLDAIYALKELAAAGEKIEIVFAGGFDPDYYKVLLDLIKEYHLDSYVHFVGFVEFPYSLYKQADAILNCSRNEAFGLVTLEAMELGKPIIAASSGGTLELIEDETDGLLYPPGDSMQLAEKIKKFVYEPELRVKLGRKAAEKARERFSQETTLTKFYEILRKVSNEKNRSTQNYFYWIMALERKNQSIRLAEMDAQLEEKNKLLKEKSAQLADRNAQLVAIYSSKIWRLGLWLRHTRLWVAPPESMRARMGRLILSIARKMINKKWLYRL